MLILGEDEQNLEYVRETAEEESGGSIHIEYHDTQDLAFDVRGHGNKFWKAIEDLEDLAGEVREEIHEVIQDGAATEEFRRAEKGCRSALSAVSGASCDCPGPSLG